MPWVAYIIAQIVMSMAMIAAQAVQGIQGINKQSSKSPTNNKLLVLY